ncbi:hypothetical protein DPMN_126003 [Dreissena polymorpha]|uniref:Uncharacterized protein n=1 Tax=Dreissena polymorpha TaxID=45954 RepID=A0A9D4GYJ5_DREPO|nr:hypothetical protein DPMN_126003 [Dreissena polymorpha]
MECTCSFYCPPQGVARGYCYSDYNGWGRPPRYCCVPSYMDFDAPDIDFYW